MGSEMCIRDRAGAHAPAQPSHAQTARTAWTLRRTALSTLEARLLLAAPSNFKEQEELVSALSRFYNGEHPVRVSLVRKKALQDYHVWPMPADSAYCFYTCIQAGAAADSAVQASGAFADPVAAGARARAHGCSRLTLLDPAAMSADELLDHLIVGATLGELDASQIGAVSGTRQSRAAGLTPGLFEVQSTLSKSVRGVRLSEYVLNFGVVESGASEKLSVLVINGSADSSVRLRAVRILGTEGEFRLAEPVPPLNNGGALLPSGARMEVHVAFDTEEVGLYRAWLFLLVDVCWSTRRAITSTSALFGCLLGAAVMPPGGAARKLSTEARPFIPESLRAIWLTPTPLRAMGVLAPAPPAPFREYLRAHSVPAYQVDVALAPAWRQMVLELRAALDELLPRAVQQLGAPHRLAGRLTSDLCGFSPSSWARTTAVFEPAEAASLAKIEESRRDGVWRKGPGEHAPPEPAVVAAHLKAGLSVADAPLGYACPPAAAVWKLLHLKLLGLLLQLEELQMTDDYQKMDVFNTAVLRTRPAQQADGTPILRAAIIGLEERHPPALVGDLLLLRPAALPQLELPCRIIGIDRRTQLLFVPPWGSAPEGSGLRNLLQDPSSHRVVSFIRQLAPFADDAAVARARADLALLFCPPQPPYGKDARATPREALVHIRFLLNRSVFEHMHLNLQAAIARIEAKMPRAGFPFGIPILPVGTATGFDIVDKSRLPLDARASVAEEVVSGQQSVEEVAGEHEPAEDGDECSAVEGLIEGAAKVEQYATRKCLLGEVGSCSRDVDLLSDGDGTQIEPFTSNINAEQLAAVRAVLGPREALRRKGERMPPYLVFGPPGTGKTVVMVELVLQLLVLHPAPRLLVCAPSNSAADVLLARLHSQMDEVRARGFASSSATSKHESSKPSVSRLMYRLNSQTRNVEDVHAQLLRYCTVDPAVNTFSVPSREALLAERVTICTCAATRMLLEVGVPCSATPCIAKGAAFLQELVEADGRMMHYTHVLIDEASQALEPEMLLPLAFAGPGCDVLICGDHMQLGPTVRSVFCRENGLATSMLERLIQLPTYQDGLKANGSDGAGDAPGADLPDKIEKSGTDESGNHLPTCGSFREASRSRTRLPAEHDRVPCVMRLVRNYRSHRSLLALPSRLFYSDALRECADTRQTSSMEQWAELRRRGFPLLFYGVRSAHTHEVDSPSFFNPVEAEKVGASFPCGCKTKAARTASMTSQRGISHIHPPHPFSPHWDRLLSSLASC